MTDQRPQANDTPPLWDDPVVEEVRSVRRRLWEAAGRDVRRYIDHARQAENRRRAAKSGKGKEAG